MNKSVEGSQEKLQVTKFVMVKVRVRHTLSYIIPMAVRAASRYLFIIFIIFTSFFALDKFLYCYVCRTPLKMAAPGAGPNTSSHMVQEVVVVHPSGTQLNLQWSGYNPVRYFVPVQHKAKHDDTETDGG